MFRFTPLLFLIFLALPLQAEDPLEFQSVTGNTVAPLETGGKAPVVLVFIAVDCPVANSYAPEINRIAEEYGSRGVKLTLVHSDPALSDEEAKAHKKDYGLTPEVVVDRKHELVKKSGARVTPEAVVFDREGEAVYRGRIDNLYTDYGDRRRQATTHELREVLDSLLAGTPITVEEKSSVGCLIELMP